MKILIKHCLLTTEKYHNTECGIMQVDVVGYYGPQKSRCQIQRAFGKAIAKYGRRPGQRARNR